MELARFAATYGTTLAAVGAAFSFTVAPSLGVYWTHWLVAGIILLLMLAFALLMNGASGFGREDADGCNLLYGAAIVLVTPLTVGLLTFVPLTHSPMLLWLLPAIVLILIWLALLAEVDGPDVRVVETRLAGIDGSHCCFRHTGGKLKYEREWAMYEVEVTAQNGSEVRIEICFGHRMEFMSWRSQGRLDKYDDIMTWIRSEGRWPVHI